MAKVQDAAGKSGRCVADTYVLCNPPYSLLQKRYGRLAAGAEVGDVDGNVGRQSGEGAADPGGVFHGIVRGQAAAAHVCRAAAAMALACAMISPGRGAGHFMPAAAATATRGRRHAVLQSARPGDFRHAHQGMGWNGSETKIKATHPATASLLNACFQTYVNGT